MLDLIEIKTAKSEKTIQPKVFKLLYTALCLVNLSNTTNLKSMLEIKLLFA